ncbi:putative mitochondrial hypothetical protein [Leptomonas pyrrhocoris]|uniref:Uncharacterized protein n=1 Tax=Leptomonas pyrrhocoris TaxID=157538 RepID=A0A0M9FUW6_LEPPY|nr:putative mitochondrial hypothetical protein [Leptomonas pyrrhocoris]KPA76447.1 putative mitochondrial hypothetical protein [Leptomonas pyrrhocoris]|eukprot:XP_015654886.1 putative mitochondrial hypothetical protein [Leptomonas pyrrhocoris]
MLRRVAGGRVVRGVGPATLPLLSTTHRHFFSRSANQLKKDSTSSTTTQTTAAAAAAATSTATAAAVTAAQVFASNEKANVITTAVGSSSGDDVVSHVQQKQQREDAVPAAAPSTGIRSIGIKLSEDDELVRAFNNFSKTVNGCTQEEFLLGARQAYASLAVVIAAFVERAQQPLVGLTESSKVIAAAHEAAKLLDQEFKPETRESTPAKAAAAAAAGPANLKAEDAISPRAGEGAGAVSPKTKLQDTLVQHVVSTITSIIPISTHLAESIFKIWMLQKEKQVNLSSIASPADYVLNSKLVIFARLDKARIYFHSDSIGAEVDVTLNNEYLRKLDPSSMGATTTPASTEGHASATTTTTAAAAGGIKSASKSHAEDGDPDEGMIQVLTDTAANAQRTTAEEHTFVLNRKTRTLTPQFSPAAAASVQGDDKEEKALAAAAAAPAKSSGASVSVAKGATASRVQVTCAQASASATSKAADAGPASPASQATDGEAASHAKGGRAAAEAVDPDESSVFIKVNGNALPPIPADARACALLTVDVVVPPERYAYNFEWFYKRIVGYENEYERIAAARVFASNSPKSLGTFVDFVMRMITGKPVEFMFSKSLGRALGVPEDVSETPPATRKLMCMYMDASHKWVLADLMTLAPVIETKLPKA